MKPLLNYKCIALSVILWIIVITIPAYPQDYPFENRNMFFGITQFKSAAELPLAQDLGVSWLSMHPVATWFTIEQKPGSYNWIGLDYSIWQLQNINLDCTPVLFAVNAFGEKRARLIEKLAGEDMTGFLRSDSSIYWKLYPNEEDSTMDIWLNFVQTLIERYDKDGVNDMPGLKYAIRNWHLLEEYPMIFIDADNYIYLLKKTSPVIKSADPNAKIIIPGLAGNFARFFAFADTLLGDEDAGVFNGEKRTRLAIKVIFNSEKQAFKKILQEGRDYYDIADVHLYEEKETFLEGKIAWMKNTINSFGAPKPIWCIEGGGPFKITEAQYLAGDTTQGDRYFGPYSDKENAEFVVKLHVMAAANGIERDHWGLSATQEGAYWAGPWKNMALATSDLTLKPSYYSFKLMVHMLNNFQSVVDKSTNDYRLYEFNINTEKCYVTWSKTGNPININMQNLFSGESEVKITHIITDLSSGINPIEETKSPVSIQIDLTPIFISKVDYPSAIDEDYNFIPTEFYLYQNYPNPFNPITTIEYQINEPGFVRLKVYNVLGQVVSQLVNEKQVPGFYKVEFNGSKLPSHIYFYRLEANQFTITKKLVLVK